jgi:hypothetical protein
MLYIITADWYDEESGHNHNILLATTDKEKAKFIFNSYTELAASKDTDEGYTIVDRTENVYYSHCDVPNYHRVILHEYKGGLT